MRRIFIAAAALAAASCLTPGATDYRPTIAGQPYRVTVRDGTVEAASKALVVSRTLAERDHLRQAVRAATGCGIADELWQENNVLVGKLDCPR